jgi:hypothetical protein
VWDHVFRQSRINLGLGGMDLCSLYEWRYVFAGVNCLFVTSLPRGRHEIYRITVDLH